MFDFKKSSTYLYLEKVFIRLTWIEMRNWYTSYSTESALRCSSMVQCLICLSLSSSFFILMNIDDLGIGRSVHNLGRGEMRVFRTSWSACSRQAGIRQQTPFLLSCLVYWPTLQWSQTVWCVTLQLASPQRVAVVWMTPSLPFEGFWGPSRLST